MGALRRAAPVPSAHPFSKRSRGAAPAPCGAMVRESSIRGVGANQKLSVPNPRYTKVVRNGIVVEMEVIPVGGGEVPNACPSMKRPRVVETATHRAGAEQFTVPSLKRTKVTSNRNVAEMSVDPPLGTLRKRMAAELDALHALLRKAELLSGGKNGRFMAAKQPSEAPVESSIKTPAAKRRKVSALAKIAESESPEDGYENTDICGAVSAVTILKASPVVSIEKAVETGNSESREVPEDKNEFVDICGGVSPVVSGEKTGQSSNSKSSSSDSGSSSSSDSDSDSDSGSSSSSDSDSDRDSEGNGTSVQPVPEPASKVVPTTEPEKLSKATLIAKANVRRKLLEMERAVLPDESIHPRELKDLCIAEYGRPGIMRHLGLFLKADA